VSGARAAAAEMLLICVWRRAATDDDHWLQWMLRQQ